MRYIPTRSPEEPSTDSKPHLVFPGIRYGGFGIRFAAYLIDFVLGGLLGSFVLLFIFFSIVYAAGGNVDEWKGPLNWVGFGWSVLYGVGFLAGFGWTPGMRIVGIQVTDGRSFGRLNLLRAIGRELGSIVSGLGFGIGYLSILWHPERRAWHDRMAGTWVVHRDSIPGREAGYRASYAASPLVSPDGRYEWDGTGWLPLLAHLSPHVISPDGRYQWDGIAWRSRA